MSVIAITGGFGTGKTTVAQMFSELGGRIIDVDAVVRELEEPKKPAWKKIVRSFGKEILNPGQIINRRKLAEIVFSDSVQLQRLNSLVHPLVLKETKKRIVRLKKEDSAQLVAVDIPLLFEAGEEKYFDFVVVVVAEEKRVTERLTKNRSLSPAEIRLRVKSQIPLEKKASRAHFVIDNNNGLEKTRRQVRQVFRRLVAEGKLFKKESFFDEA